MKRVLIITYYWPPGGGAGVQRWLKFTKYLREFGWEPVIYTPSNPEPPVIDNSLESDIPKNLEVIQQPIWEPYSVYKRFIGQKQDQKINAGFLSEREKPKLSEKLSVWIRGNLFIPDARKFWIKPSIKFLVKYLKDHQVDVIVSTGPPHSMHMIAMGLAKRTGLPWLADFRDPWTNIDFYKDLQLSAWADRKHRKLEKQILSKADEVCVISNGMAADFRSILNRDYQVITNGYDEDDIQDTKARPDKKFSISHIGSMVSTRNPEAFWKAISGLIKENKAFKEAVEIKLIGKVDIDVQKSIEKFQLENYVTRIAYLPHDQVIEEQRKSRVLLLIINNTPNARLILTGKFFEYMAAKRPILCLGPADGDAADIIHELNTGLVSGFDDHENIRRCILQFFDDYQNGKTSLKPGDISRFSRRNLSGVLAKLLDRTISGTKLSQQTQ